MYKRARMTGKGHAQPLVRGVGTNVEKSRVELGHGRGACEEWLLLCEIVRHSLLLSFCEEEQAKRVRLMRRKHEIADRK